jgi:hypothetical protein
MSADRAEQLDRFLRLCLSTRTSPASPLPSSLWSVRHTPGPGRLARAKTPQPTAQADPAVLAAPLPGESSPPACWASSVALRSHRQRRHRRGCCGWRRRRRRGGVAAVQSPLGWRGVAAVAAFRFSASACRAAFCCARNFSFRQPFWLRFRRNGRLLRLPPHSGLAG